MIRRIWLVPALILVIMLGQPRGPAAQGQEKPKGTEEQKQPQDAPQAATAQNQQGPKKRNPFTGNAEAIKEGRSIYMQSGCNGCHGMGGGGMGPALLDDTWKWGGDDETLFKLIKGQIPNQTMPSVFGAVLSEEQVWKVIAWIRSIYKGDPDKIIW
jgi:cytochrome c(L)